MSLLKEPSQGFPSFRSAASPPASRDGRWLTERSRSRFWKWALSSPWSERGEIKTLPTLAHVQRWSDDKLQAARTVVRLVSVGHEGKIANARAVVWYYWNPPAWLCAKGLPLLANRPFRTLRSVGVIGLC